MVQRRLGLALRARVAGEDAPERAQRIWGTTGPRWFTPEDPIWRVHADASMFAGGIASLLLQSLHPLAMAGVAGHSGYKSDPWGRLQRTSHYIATTTYGTIEDAEAAIARVRAIHERVRGRDERGRAYRASDPHLLLWVHVAEIDSFLRAYQAFGARPLGPREMDRYVEQTAVAARLLGVPGAPDGHAGSAPRPRFLPAGTRGDRSCAGSGSVPPPRAAAAARRTARLRDARVRRGVTATPLGASHAPHTCPYPRGPRPRAATGPARGRRGSVGDGGRRGQTPTPRRSALESDGA